MHTVPEANEPALLLLTLGDVALAKGIAHTAPACPSAIVHGAGELGQAGLI